MKIFLTLNWLLFTSNILFAQNDSDYLTYQDLLHGLEEIATKYMEPSDVVKQEFLVLKKTHNISDDKENYHDFVRVRLAFEATRDSGLWQIRWAVTDKEPNSDSIWKQWSTLLDPQYQTEEIAQPTAVAECDELSAMFAFIARGLGVKNVGLFWPTWNHTVAVWTAKGNSGDPVRIVIPTSQIYLSPKATLGTTEFDPYKQKTIYPYSRKDISLSHPIPKKMVIMMLSQAKKYGAESSQTLQERRNRLSRKFGGSLISRALQWFQK